MYKHEYKRLETMLRISKIYFIRMEMLHIIIGSDVEEQLELMFLAFENIVDDIENYHHALKHISVYSKAQNKLRQRGAKVYQNNIVKLLGEYEQMVFDIAETYKHNDFTEWENKMFEDTIDVLKTIPSVLYNAM